MELARQNIAAAALDHRIVVHEGDFAAVLPTLDPGYDSRSSTATRRCRRCISRWAAFAHRRLLITANLNHGGTADAVAKALFDGKSWRSALGRRRWRNRD